MYASQATSHQASNQGQGCGLVGDRWSNNTNGHFRWCLGASEGQLQAETEHGRTKLLWHVWKLRAEATNLQHRNGNNQCGYSGDPWSVHTSNHFRWRMGASQQAINAQADFRRSEIAKCESCRTYATRAVDAFHTTRICGYAGDRWSPDLGGHFRWCTSVPAWHSQNEGAARDTEVGKC